MGVPFWLDNPDAWDKPVVAGITMPGICEVDGTGLAKLDRKSAPGSSGATLTYLGADPIEASITVTIWTKEHLATLQQVLDKITPLPGKGTRQPVTVSHPKFSMARVTRLFVSKIGMLKKSSRLRGGAMDLTINFVQHFPSVGGQTGTFGSKAASAAPSLTSLDNSTAPAATEAEPNAATGFNDFMGNYYASADAASQSTGTQIEWSANAPSKTNGDP